MNTQTCENCLFGDIIIGFKSVDGQCQFYKEVVCCHDKNYSPEDIFDDCPYWENKFNHAK